MPGPHDAEMVGAHPALDFLNTIHDWTVAEPRDYLADFSDAIRFGEASGLLTQAESRFLANTPSGSELSRLRKLRGVLERLFRARVRSSAPAGDDLDQLATIGIEVARASSYRSAAGAGAEAGTRALLMREIAVKSAGAAAVRLRIADSAIALLTSRQAGRIKECPGCGWFFLDGSKNQSRRWCSMNTCGASAKSKAYYRRQNA